MPAAAPVEIPPLDSAVEEQVATLGSPVLALPASPALPELSVLPESAVVLAGPVAVDVAVELLARSVWRARFITALNGLTVKFCLGQLPLPPHAKAFELHGTTCTCLPGAVEGDIVSV